MKIYIHYSPEDDQIILEEIKKSPTNLKKAFEQASERLPGRKAASIAARWYKSLKYKYPYIVTAGSAKGFSNNVKNDIDGSHNLKPFQVIVKHMLELSDSDRHKIIEFFK